jgi:hypothetical protein
MVPMPAARPLRRFLVNVAIAALVIVAWILWRPRRAAPPALMHHAPAPAPIGPGYAVTAAPHLNPNPPGPPPGEAIVDNPSELAVGLNAPTQDVKADLRQINDIFMHYRSAIHGDNPIGDNEDITAVLTGRNPLGFAFIPKDCPAINGNGELCDRWGTPYFFHQLSAQEMEIRSAGPDRKMWTDDDVLLTP